MKAYFSILQIQTLCLDTLMCISMLEPFLFPFRLTSSELFV